VTLLKNKNYWGTPPNVDGMLIKIHRDAQAMTAGFEAGTLDVVDSPALVDFVRLKADPKYQPLVIAETGAFVCVVANCGMAPTDNKLFRQGLNYAMNRKRFVDTYFKGVINDWQDIPYPPSAPAYDAAKAHAYPFDLDQAKALINQSGVTNTDIDFTYSGTQYGDLSVLFGQILQSDLASIGVNMTLKGVDFATAVDIANKRSYKGLLISAGSGALLGEATSLLTRSRFFMPNSQTSWTGLDDPRYSQAVALGASEPDASKRKAAYGQILDIILDDSATNVVSLYPSTSLASSKVHELSYGPTGALTFATSWLE
jgi:peptide/nickel transport system substrate-binding protein